MTFNQIRVEISLNFEDSLNPMERELGKLKVADSK